MKVDPKRWAKREELDGQTRIYVRAQTPDGKWHSVDIALLDHASLLQWLRSRGGSNPWAENTVCILLGHEPLHQSGSGGLAILGNGSTELLD
jgi:hypothetical protein